MLDHVDNPSRMDLMHAAIHFARVAEQRHERCLAGDGDCTLTSFHRDIAVQTAVTVAMSALHDAGDMGPIGQTLGKLLENREAIANVSRCEPEYRELTGEAYELRQLIWRLIKKEYCKPLAA